MKPVFGGFRRCFPGCQYLIFSISMRSFFVSKFGDREKGGKDNKSNGLISSWMAWLSEPNMV